jgi:hypothetical protein
LLRLRQLEIAMDDVPRLRPTRFRNIFVAEVHLSFKGCQAELLLDFLCSTRCQCLLRPDRAIALAGDSPVMICMGRG